MFCTKCGKQIDKESKFCEHCGEATAFNNAQATGLGKTNQPSSTDPSTGKIFMEQLGDLAKTGARGIKEAAMQAQSKAGELSASVEQSQSLNQLGEKKNLFLFVCGALVLNIILLLSKTIYFEMSYYNICI